MDIDLKNELLNLLSNDVDVIKQIKLLLQTENCNKAINISGVTDEEYVKVIKKLEEKNFQIKQEKDTLEKDLERINKYVNEKDIEIDVLKRKNEQTKINSHNAIEKYEALLERYMEIDSIYRKYMDLDERIIKKLERILNPSSTVSTSPQLFMAYGIQENNIIALWESIAINYEYYKNLKKEQDLIDIFLFFLNLYREISFKTVIISWPTAGDVYDERIHTRTQYSNVVGKIQKIILPGFKIGKNVTKKALVLVK